MKVFIATNNGQKSRLSDFCFADNGEMVVFPMTCDRDRNDPNPDGGCGCGRSMVGMISHKATTTFTVADRDLTGQQFTDLYLGAYQDTGWTLDASMRSELAKEAAEMLRCAAAMPLGSVLEFRKETIQERSKTLLLCVS